MNITTLIKNHSIRIFIVLIIFGHIIIFAALTGYLAYTSGLRTITENANRISSLVNAEIAKTLINYLEEPLQMQQFHKNILLNQQIDFANQPQRDKYFVEALRIFSGVANTYIGLANGDEYGARREDDGSFVVWEGKVEKNGLDYYRYNVQSGRQGYLKSLSPYDTRTRPPYRKGVELKKPGWTEVYPSATGRGLVVTAVLPVYDRQNELIGVLGSSLLLNWMDEFLRSLSVTEHSSIYIIDRNGEIIASTQSSVPQAKSPLLSQALKALGENKQSIEPIQGDISLTFCFNDEEYIAHVRSIQGKNRLDWLSVMIIPQNDLTQGTSDLTRQLLIITLAACVFGLGAGVLSARHIIAPILRVNLRAKAIAGGDFSSRLATDRRDEIGQLISTINDMSTQLERYIGELRDEQLRTKLLTTGLETSSNLVVILDKNRLIWWVNAAFEELSGYTLAELKGQTILTLLPKQNDPQVLLQVRECLLQQREWRGEFIARSKDDHHFVDEVWITPVRDDAGNTSYYLAIGKDITETVKAREALSEAQKAQAKAERLYLIGTMASGIAHEINQPLSSVKVITGGLLYMLRQGNALSSEDYQEHLEEINKQTDRISGIIKHLRSFIRDEQSALVPCDLNSIMKEVLILVGPRLKEHGIRIHEEFQSNLPLVMAHPVGLEQVGVNLLTNALEALDKADISEKHVIIRTCFDQHVILEIGNNGPAISPQLEETLFEPFTSSKKSGNNQGLGLAIVRSTLNLYKGTIELAQSDAERVLFRIALPAKKHEDPVGTVGDEPGS